LDFVKTRYLSAKRTVDDRALNRAVLDVLRAELAGLRDQPLQVLELGAGVGTMAQRLFEWTGLARAHYTLVDSDPECLHAARRQLEGPQRACPYRFEYACHDLFAFLELPESIGSYDLIVANAVLDLVDVPRLLPLLWRVLKPARPYWFSINFDGDTTFAPELELDREVLRLFHRSMDRRVHEGQPSGHSQTGRRLLQQIPASGASITGSGSSDSEVAPRAGGYPYDEAYFLHHIVHIVDNELRAHPELDAAAFQSWVEARHEQIRNGELRYAARQLDITGRASEQG